jgi:hypothetical protein
VLKAIKAAIQLGYEPVKVCLGMGLVINVRKL